MNQTIIVANWKMNPSTKKEAQALLGNVIEHLELQEGTEVVLCPPFPYLSLANDMPKGIALGAQNSFWNAKGAYTGEVSPHMLKDLGCSYVILGHSEREKYLGETQDVIQKKMDAALSAGLKVILCVGESEETPQEKENLIVAYEPEWAISTEKDGHAADTEKVTTRVAQMRKILPNTPILYGGSVDETNIAQFLKECDVQGALVGSASLDALKFVQLVKNIPA